MIWRYAITYSGRVAANSADEAEQLAVDLHDLAPDTVDVQVEPEQERHGDD